MIIDELYIRSFGKLKDFRLSLTEKLNVIYGANEAGKSTILAFIRQMLYGGRERKRYQPRDGSPASGAMLFRHNGKKYLLERTFGATRRGDVITLKNADTGTLIPVPLKQEPGEWLFDLAEDTFINTVYIGQLACAFDGPKMGGGVVAKLSNLNRSGDEELSFAKTDERLKKAANALSYRGRGKIPDLQRQLEALEEERKSLNISREILHAKSLQIAALKSEVEEAQVHKRRCENYLEICSARRELEEFSEIEKISLQIAEKESESGAAQGETPDGLLYKAKVVYSECEKAEAVIASCERDFSGQNAGYRSLLKEYETAGDMTDIDFDRIADLEAQAERANAVDDKKKPSLWLACGIGACLVLTLLFVLLSIKTFRLMVPAILSSCGAFVFAMLYRKAEKAVVEEENAAEIARNELEGILQQAGCENIAALMRKKEAFEQLGRRMNDLRAVRACTAENLKSAKAKKAALEQNLFQILSPVADVRTMREALEAIESMEGKNAQGERELTALRARLDALLRGRTFAALQSRACVLRDKLSEIKIPDSFDPEAAEACRSELDGLNVEISEKSANIARLEGETEGADKGAKTPEELESEIEACRERLAAYQARFSAAELARTALNAANDEMSSAFAPAINVSAAKILSEITAGRYDDIRVSGELEPAVLDKNDSTFVAKESLSGGTADQLYLALRLAVSERLFDGAEPLPLLMDEAMVQYDDERMAKGIAYLAGLPQQVVFFTCKKRELEAAEEYDGVNIVSL